MTRRFILSKKNKTCPERVLRRKTIIQRYGVMTIQALDNNREVEVPEGILSRIVYSAGRNKAYCKYILRSR